MWASHVRNPELKSRFSAMRTHCYTCCSRLHGFASFCLGTHWNMSTCIHTLDSRELNDPLGHTCYHHCPLVSWLGLRLESFALADEAGQLGQLVPEGPSLSKNVVCSHMSKFHPGRSGWEEHVAGKGIGHQPVLEQPVHLVRTLCCLELTCVSNVAVVGQVCRCHQRHNGIHLHASATPWNQPPGGLEAALPRTWQAPVYVRIPLMPLAHFGASRS